MADGVSPWAMAGLGSGEIDDAEAGVQASDLTQQMAGATLIPSIELGLRNVGGDGETGTVSCRPARVSPEPETSSSRTDQMRPAPGRVAGDRPEVSLQTARHRCPDGSRLQNVAPAANGVEGRTGEYAGDCPDSSWARLMADSAAAQEEFGANGGVWPPPSGLADQSRTTMRC